MNRQIGLGVNSYTSFTADAPRAFSTKEETKEPGPDDFDAETGQVKADFVRKVMHRAYPEKHSVWDKITCSADLSLSQFAEWLATEHGLKLQIWDFVLGHRTETDKENRKVLVGVSTPIYPPKVQLNYALLPPLDLALPQATMQIMRNTAAKPTQQYIQLWKDFKAQGLTEVPPPPALEGPVITGDMKLRDILRLMDAKAQEKLAKKEMETATISHVDQREFVLIWSSDAPYCVEIASGEHVENLCTIKINLK
jgi:hypothetical protein